MHSSRCLEMLRPTRPINLGWLLAFPLLALLGASAMAQDDQQATDVAVGNKLGGYVKCINSHSHWVLKSRDRYFSWLKSPQQGPTGKEPIVYGLYKLHDVRSCRTGLEAAAAMPPSLPALEQAGSDWIAAFLAAEAVVAEANDYYELQNYKDDRMQGGKALHPRLVAAYAGFERADDALRAVVEETQDGVALRRLERLAQTPALRVEYLAERLLMEAKRVLRSAAGLGRKEFNQAPFAASVASLEVAWRELDEHRKANPDDRREVIRSSSFANAAFELLKSAKAAERRSRNGFRLDDSEKMLAENGAAQLVDGHPVQLLEKYNGFIDAANRTRW